MRQIEINKKIIIAVLITFVISLSSTVYATIKYNANEIEYKNSTVGNALNELYNDSNNKIYKVGSVLYVNPETGAKCEDYKESNSNTEVKTGCLKWYVYKYNDDDTYQLILDHNTTATVRWSSTSSNTTNGDTVTAQLKSDVAAWKEELKARLITADEVAEIVGANRESTIKWSSAKSIGTTISTQSYKFYLDGGSNADITSYSTTNGWQKQSANATNLSKYGWLFDRTHTDCKSAGCFNNSDSGYTLYAYWTSTPTKGDTNYAWLVGRYGSLDLDNITYGNSYGVRPVITFKN